MTGLPVRAVLVLAVVALVLGACGDGDRTAPPAAGRYALDRMDFARKLADAHLKHEDGSDRKNIGPDRLEQIRTNAVAKARSIQLELELRADGAFMARFTDASGEQRFGGTWTQDGEAVTFRTTSIPGGRVTTIPDVRARRTADGLAFDDKVSGFVVPHAFLLRPVD